VQSPSRSILEVNDFADRVVRERIQTIPGVSNVRIFGEKRYAMRLWLDPLRLAAHGLTPLDVQDALDAQNVDLPSDASREAPSSSRCAPPGGWTARRSSTP
jgi:multidrug efflux pump subunit AcrB